MEVLSASTERYDRGLKFARYRQIASLEEYVLVAQAEPHVEVLRRQTDGSWSLWEYEGPEAATRLQSLGVAIPLARLYQDIEFSAGYSSNPAS